MIVGEGGEGGILLKVKATLVSAEVSAGAVAKADQYNFDNVGLKWSSYIPGIALSLPCFPLETPLILMGNLSHKIIIIVSF